MSVLKKVTVPIVMVAQFLVTPTVLAADSRLNFVDNIGKGCKFRIFSEHNKKEYWTIHGRDQNTVYGIEYKKYPGKSHTPVRQHFFIKPIVKPSDKVKAITKLAPNTEVTWAYIQANTSGSQFVTRDWGASGKGFSTQYPKWPGKLQAGDEAHIWAQIFAIGRFESNKLRLSLYEDAKPHERYDVEYGNGFGPRRKNGPIAKKQVFFAREVGCPILHEVAGASKKYDSTAAGLYYHQNTIAATATEFRRHVPGNTGELRSLVSRTYVPWTLVYDKNYEQNYAVQYDRAPWYVFEHYRVAEIRGAQEFDSGGTLTEETWKEKYTSEEHYKEVKDTIAFEAGAEKGPFSAKFSAEHRVLTTSHSAQSSNEGSITSVATTIGANRLAANVIVKDVFTIRPNGHDTKEIAHWESIVNHYVLDVPLDPNDADGN